MGVAEKGDLICHSDLLKLLLLYNYSIQHILLFWGSYISVITQIQVESLSRRIFKLSI